MRPASPRESLLLEGLNFSGSCVCSPEETQISKAAASVELLRASPKLPCCVQSTELGFSEQAPGTGSSLNVLWITTDCDLNHNSEPKKNYIG